MFDDEDLEAANNGDALPSIFTPLDLRLPVDLLVQVIRAERARHAAVPMPMASAERELHAWRDQQLVDLLAWLHTQGELAGISLYVTETDIDLSDEEIREITDGAGEAEEDDQLL